MPEYDGPAQLIPVDDGERINVVVNFSVRQRRAGLSEWSGTLSSRTGEPLFLEPGEFTLRLPDGKEGRALVHRVLLMGGTCGIRESISFVGSDSPT